jgi:putative FmdB family regulatory protein
MPTYEYECRKCRRRFEEFQKMTDPPLKNCPFCKGCVTRLITGGAGLIFKGSGFYITDYKKAPASASGAGETKAAAKKKAVTGEKTAGKGTGGEGTLGTTEKKGTVEKKAGPGAE